ncbi:MAG: endo-1,4-beta-xylanase [Planctomycetota bacterium]
MSRIILCLGFVGIVLLGPCASIARAETRQVAQYSGTLMPLDGPPRLGGDAIADADLELVTDERHGDGFVVTTRQQPMHHYSIEVRQPLGMDVRKGDVLFASFWARAREGSRYETGEAYTLFRIQRTKSPWERALYREFVAGPTWSKFYVGERMDHAIPASELAAVFSAGFPAQTLEVAGLEVVNLGSDADHLALPRMATDYLGSEADAPWREQAEQRIREHRMADLAVRVLDASGEPVPGATVDVEMTRHAFNWGVAISAEWLDENWEEPAADAYRGTIKKTFNSVALENALKWSRWEGDPSVAMRSLKWAKSQGLTMHGHVLVWPGLQKFRVADAQEVWAAAQDDPQILRDRINGHIIDILSNTAGYVDTWDVVNEAYNQNELLNLLGRDEFTAWFKLARRYAPDAKLMYNDFALLGQSGTNRKKHQWVYDLLDEAIANGAPIDAIGFQAHLGGGYTPPQRVLDILDKFAGLGIELKITEYDLTTSGDPQLAERYTRDFLTAIFSHPSVTSFQGWNFWSATPTWMPEASWFDERWRPLPVGKAYAAMVQDAWWTHEDVTTDASGVANVRGFLGEYAVTVTAPDGRTHEATATLTREGKTLDVVLPSAP